MKPERTSAFDHPSLEDLECLIMCPEGTKGYIAEKVLLQRLYGSCLVHGFGDVFQMTDGIYDIWLHPERIEQYKQARQEHLDKIQKGLKIYDDESFPAFPPPEPKVDIRELNRRIREENKVIRASIRTQTESNQKQILFNQAQHLQNQDQASDNQGQALDNQGQALDNREIRTHRENENKPNQ